MRGPPRSPSRATRAAGQRLPLALVAAIGDERPRVERLRVRRQDAELVVTEVDDVLWFVEETGRDELAPDRDRGRRTRAFVP